MEKENKEPETPKQQNLGYHIIRSKNSVFNNSNNKITRHTKRQKSMARSKDKSKSTETVPEKDTAVYFWPLEFLCRIYKQLIDLWFTDAC